MGPAGGQVTTLALATLKRRADFLRVRQGSRWTTPAFVLEAHVRRESDGGDRHPRFGFTVTKRIGNAVARNRARRRLRAGVQHLAGEHARAGMDYVLIARSASLDRAFSELVSDLAVAFARVNQHASAQRSVV